MFVTKKMPKSLSAEAYRNLRTSIKFAEVDKDIKTIVVTSSIPGEGKSTVAGNLAITLSYSGAKVLLVDCDLRSPTLHTKYEVSNEIGLTNMLVDKREFKETVNEVVDNLFLLTAGTIPPNPSEIIGSQSMDKLAKEFYKNFDYVIFDTPPVMAVTDALLLAAKADATIMVVRARKTKEKFIKAAYEELTKVKANVIGSILNDSDTRTSDRYGEYYGNTKKRGRSKRK